MALITKTYANGNIQFVPNAEVHQFALKINQSA